MIRVYHIESKIHGVGVYPYSKIKSGDIIGVSHVSYDSYWYMTTHGYYNHSEKPNCIIRNKGNINLIIAKKDIEIEEELIVDYRLQPYLEQPKGDWVK